jgi:diguanylate cyclase (GGDEF)-like protein
MLSIIMGMVFNNFYFSIVSNIMTLILTFLIFKDENLYKLLILNNLSTLILLFILIKVLKNYNKFNYINSNLYLPNHSIALKRLSELIETYKSNNDINFAVAAIDLDCLKTINKKEGYDAGDYIIFQVSNRIKNNLNKNHIVVRSGGDEFAIIFSNIVTKKECLKIVNSILLDLRKSFIYNNNPLYISASIGLVFNNQKFVSVDEYMRAASISLEKAKFYGKNRICIFDNLKDEIKIRRFKIEKDLKDALEKHELELYYQPILKLNNKKEVGLEALIRWNHPELGLISPGEFIPIAENTGLIIDIGKFVIREACRTLCSINGYVNDNFSMNINISPKQLKDKNLYDVIHDSIIQLNINPERIHIEITESALIDDLEISKLTLNKLVEFGVKIHLDDFGTGYSSLSYLHMLPINSLKIDKSFIENLMLEQKNYQLLKSIILMGKELNMHVIAEGIEDINRYNRLLEMGCEFGQGYYFSKPLKVSDLLIYLENKIFLKNAI